MPKPVHHPSHEVLFQMAVMGVLAILVMINLGSEWDQEKITLTYLAVTDAQPPSLCLLVLGIWYEAFTTCNS